MTDVRRARRSDLADLAALYRREIETQEAFADSFRLSANIDWSGYAASRLRHADTAVWVALVDDAVVGFLEATLANERNDVGMLEEVYVRPEARNRGCFARLMREALGWMRRKSVRETRAMVWAGNDVAERLLRELGFDCAAISMRKRVRT